MSNIKFSDYSLDNLKKFLEQKLYIKLSKIGVKTIGDFEKLTLSEFSSHKGIGTNAIKLFLILRHISTIIKFLFMIK